jgi:hypothetical protein
MRSKIKFVLQFCVYLCYKMCNRNPFISFEWSQGRLTRPPIMRSFYAVCAISVQYTVYTELHFKQHACRLWETCVNGIGVRDHTQVQYPTQFLHILSRFVP